MPSLKVILRYTTARWVPRQLMIGADVKQYGPFRLHEQAHAITDGRLRKLSRYFVVAGDISVPLFLTLGASRDDPRGYASVVKERHGPFRNCVYVGDIPIKRSTDQDLYDHVDRWLDYKRMAISCFAEQLSIARGPLTVNPRREKFYREEIAKLEKAHQIVRDAFSAFIEEYPNTIATTNRDAALKERQARRDRKGMQVGVWFINRHLK